MVDFTRRVGLGRPLTYQEADDNFEFVEEQADLAEGYAQDAQGHAGDAEGFAITAQNAADSAQNIIDDAVADIEFAVEDNANRIRNLEYGDGPYPSLDLLFTGAKSVDPRIEFERATPATYYDAMGVLRTAGPNEPRIDYDPATGECRGLLVEGSRTNLLKWSEHWTSGSLGNGWYQGAGFFRSMVAGDHPERPGELVCHFGPDNGVSSVNNNINQQVLNIGPEGTYIVRLDLKAVPGTTGVNTVRFLCTPIDGGSGEVGGVLNLFGGGGVRSEVFSPGDSFSSQEIGSDPLGNGWYRCWIKFTTIRTIGQMRAARAFPIKDGSSISGDGESGLLGTMAQLEVGSFPTSYIPTEGSQVTRAADSTSIPTSAFPFNWRAGTLVFDRGDAPYTNDRFTVAIGQNNSNYLGLDYNSTNIAFFQPFAGIIPGSNSELSDPHKYAASWEVLSPTEVSLQIARDGVIVISQIYEGDTSLISLWDKVTVGRRFGAFEASSLMVKGLTIYPHALSEAQLIALTS